MLVALLLYGAPGAIRTPDRLVRSQVLYPAELRALGGCVLSMLSVYESTLFHGVFNNFYTKKFSTKAVDKFVYIRL